MPTADDLKKFFATGERTGAPAGARIGAAPIGSRITQAILGSGVLEQPIARLLLGSDATKARMQDPLAASAPSEAIMIGSRSPMFNRDAAKGFVEALRKIPVVGRRHPNIVQNLWDRFRTFVGPDNRLRQEISDEGLRVNTGFPDEVKRKVYGQGRPISVEHPELAKAYPGLMDQLTFRNSRYKENLGEAAYIWSFPEQRRNPAGEIVLGRPTVGGLKDLKGVSPAEINQTHRSNIAHELQHAVQRREGFAPGSNLRRYEYLPTEERLAFRELMEAERRALRKKLGDTRGASSAPRGWDQVGEIENPEMERRIAYEYYHRTPGEVEARLVQHRLLNQSPLGRALGLTDLAPPLQYDVPLAKMARPRR